MHVILTFMLLFVHNSGNIAVFGVMITDIIDFHEHLSTDVPKNSSNGMWMLDSLFSPYPHWEGMRDVLYTPGRWQLPV